MAKKKTNGISDETVSKLNSTVICKISTKKTRDETIIQRSNHIDRSKISFSIDLDIIDELGPHSVTKLDNNGTSCTVTPPKPIKSCNPYVDTNYSFENPIPRFCHEFTTTDHRNECINNTNDLSYGNVLGSTEYKGDPLMLPSVEVNPREFDSNFFNENSQSFPSSYSSQILNISSSLKCHESLFMPTVNTQSRVDRQNKANGFHPLTYHNNGIENNDTAEVYSSEQVNSNTKYPNSSNTNGYKNGFARNSTLPPTFKACSTSGTYHATFAENNRTFSFENIGPRCNSYPKSSEFSTETHSQYVSPPTKKIISTIFQPECYSDSITNSFFNPNRELMESLALVENSDFSYDKTYTSHELNLSNYDLCETFEKKCAVEQNGSYNSNHSHSQFTSPSNDISLLINPFGNNLSHHNYDQYNSSIQSPRDTSQLVTYSGLPTPRFPYINAASSKDSSYKRPQRQNVQMFFPSQVSSTVEIETNSSLTSNSFAANDTRDYLLDEFRSSPAIFTSTHPTTDILGHVVNFSRDQHGSRYIQQVLNLSSPDQFNMIFDEIVASPDCLHILMVDVFGNYVIQKLLEHGSYEHHSRLLASSKNYILDLSVEMYGCRVVQKAIECSVLEHQLIIINELDGHVQMCIKDQNGNHVIQKCIERVGSENLDFLINAFRDRVFEFSTHAYGCRVIQRIMEHCSNEQVHVIMSELLNHIPSLVRDQYGNYVIQHILEHSVSKAKNRSLIVDLVIRDIYDLSTHKFASNVVERCYFHSSPNDRSRIIECLIRNKPGCSEDFLLTLVKDQYANYVIQKIVDNCEEKHARILLERIKPHYHDLKKFNYAKHILPKLDNCFIKYQMSPPLPPSQISISPNGHSHLSSAATYSILPVVITPSSSLTTSFYHADKKVVMVSPDYKSSINLEEFPVYKSKFDTKTSQSRPISSPVVNGGLAKSYQRSQNTRLRDSKFNCSSSLVVNLKEPQSEVKIKNKTFHQK